MKVLNFLAAVGFFCAALPAKADMASDCENSDNNSVIIQSCTEVILSGQWTGSGLAWAYLNRGTARNRQNDHSNAVIDYTKAIELKPGYVKAYVSRGWAYFNLGDYVSARSDLEYGVSLDPNYGLGYENRGLVYCRLDDPIQAYSDLRKSIRMGSWTTTEAQSFLRDQGYYSGAVDGLFGSGSERSLKQWISAGCYW